MTHSGNLLRLYNTGKFAARAPLSQPPLQLSQTKHWVLSNFLSTAQNLPKFNPATEAASQPFNHESPAFSLNGGLLSELFPSIFILPSIRVTLMPNLPRQPFCFALRKLNTPGRECTAGRNSLCITNLISLLFAPVSPVQTTYRNRCKLTRVIDSDCLDDSYLITIIVSIR